MIIRKLLFWPLYLAALCGVVQAALFREPITPKKYRHTEYDVHGYAPAYCPDGLPSFDAQRAALHDGQLPIRTRRATPDDDAGSTALEGHRTQ